MASESSFILSISDEWFRKHKESVAVSTESRVEHQIEGNDKGETSVNSQQCGFLNLPIDILHCITDFLEYEDEACLLLCNKAFRRVLGSKAWQSIRIGAGSDEHRKKFLLYYARGYVDCFLCHDCLTLHTVNRVGILARLKYQDSIHHSAWLQDRANFQTITRGTFKVHHSGNKIFFWTFEMVHLAMMRHMNDQEHEIPLNRMSMAEFRHDHLDAMTQLSVDPIIVRGELHLYIKSLYMSDVNNIRGPIWTEMMRKSPHIRNYDSGLIRKFVECNLRHSDQRPTAHLRDRLEMQRMRIEIPDRLPEHWGNRHGVLRGEDAQSRTWNRATVSQTATPSDFAQNLPFSAPSEMERVDGSNTELHDRE